MFPKGQIEDLLVSPTKSLNKINPLHSSETSWIWVITNFWSFRDMVTLDLTPEHRDAVFSLYHRWDLCINVGRLWNSVIGTFVYILVVRHVTIFLWFHLHEKFFLCQRFQSSSWWCLAPGHCGWLFSDGRAVLDLFSSLSGWPVFLFWYYHMEAPSLRWCCNREGDGILIGHQTMISLNQIPLWSVKSKNLLVNWGHL